VRGRVGVGRGRWTRWRRSSVSICIIVLVKQVLLVPANDEAKEIQGSLATQLLKLLLLLLLLLQLRRLLATSERKQVRLPLLRTHKTQASSLRPHRPHTLVA
jgi:hypothetical protein